MAPDCKSLGGSGVASANAKSDLRTLYDLRLEYPKKSFVWLPEYYFFAISEIKVHGIFPNAHLTLSNYGVRKRRDRDIYSDCLIRFIRKNLICKRLRKI